MLMQGCFWIVAAPLLCMASGELHGQPCPAPHCRSPWSAARHDGVIAGRWQTLAVLTRGRPAACPWFLCPGGCAWSLSSHRHRCPVHVTLCLGLHWANGSRAPSWERSDVCLLSPSLTFLLWWRTKSQIIQGTCPNPIIERSYFRTRVWGNMHLFCQITPKDGRPSGSISKLNPAVPKLSAVSFY